MTRRIQWILLALAMFWTVLWMRAAWLQILPNERLAHLERRQYETIVELRSRRGDVFDRNGHEMAVSMTAYSLYADPSLVHNPRGLSRFLGTELGQSERAILAKLKNRTRRFVWLSRWLDKSTADRLQLKLKSLKAYGLGLLPESKRIYPNDKLLANVLGFVGSEGQGLDGLESRYEEDLQSIHKNVNMRKDAHGRPLIVNGQVFREAPDGADLELTIDRELQFFLEQELALAAEQNRADSAMGVILDPQTSEVLAMAMVPSFDPNHAGHFSEGMLRNRVVTDAFEAGSIMKPFVVASALEHHLIEPNTKFDCEGGSMRIGDRIIREADTKHNFKWLTVTEILAHSSNIGAAKIGFLLGPERLREGLLSFGFGAKSNLDLPGETKGIVRPLPWGEHLLANISFGHGIGVSAIQIANAYAAIANGGWLHRPFVVKAVRDHETGEKIVTQVQTLRRALSAEHVAKLRIMLSAVTAEDATGWNARVPGFPVAGKTGTAQKVNPNGLGYLKDTYISSFAGFVPANDPRFVIFISVDNPKRAYYGSQVAAPVFSRVAKFAVRRAALPPVLISESDLVPKNTAPPSVIQPPPSFLDFEQAAEKTDSQAIDRAWMRMPNLLGLSLREVIEKSQGSDIALQIRGHGYVTRTSPMAGTLLESVQANSPSANGSKKADKKTVTVYLSNDDHQSQ